MRRGQLSKTVKAADDDKIAAKEYAKKQKEIIAKMKSIEAKLKKHAEEFKKNDSNWGFVGDITSVVNYLDVIERVFTGYYK